MRVYVYPCVLLRRRRRPRPGFLLARHAEYADTRSLKPALPCHAPSKSTPTRTPWWHRRYCVAASERHEQVVLRQLFWLLFLCVPNPWCWALRATAKIGTRRSRAFPKRSRVLFARRPRPATSPILVRHLKGFPSTRSSLDRLSNIDWAIGHRNAFPMRLGLIREQEAVRNTTATCRTW